jgi:hypothetical protein
MAATVQTTHGFASAQRKVGRQKGSILVDMWMELHNVVLVCECDENDHRTYSMAREVTRMHRLARALEAQCGKPVRLGQLRVNITTHVPQKLTG